MLDVIHYFCQLGDDMNRMRNWPFSYWAFFSLIVGLISCIAGMIYVIYAPTDVDYLNVYTMPVAETPFVSSQIGQNDVSDTLDQIWASTVWIGREVAPGVTKYVGSGWVMGHGDATSKGDNKLSYIATCAHVAAHRTDLPLKVSYLGRSGIWSEVPAWEVRRLDTRYNGDIAIIAIEGRLQPLRFANNQNTFTVGDEVFIAGVQYTAPPAIITAGVISAVDKKAHEFQIKGWAWHGFSGGPIILRRTGEVIGYTAWSVKGHANDAMKSDCADLTHLMKLLKTCGLENIIPE